MPAQGRRAAPALKHFVPVSKTPATEIGVSDTELPAPPRSPGLFADDEYSPTYVEDMEQDEGAPFDPHNEEHYPETMRYTRADDKDEKKLFAKEALRHQYASEPTNRLTMGSKMTKGQRKVLRKKTGKSNAAP